MGWASVGTILNHTIYKLSSYEKHEENVYTSVCDVYYQLKKYQQMDTLRAFYNKHICWIQHRFDSCQRISWKWLASNWINWMCQGPCVHYLEVNFIAYDVSRISKLHAIWKEILISLWTQNDNERQATNIWFATKKI